MGVKERRYKLWWSGNASGTGGFGILVKEELFEKVVEVRRKSDRVMVVLLTYGEEVVKILFAHGLQSGRPVAEKQLFYDKVAYKWDLQSAGELVLGLGDFNGHVGRHSEGFEVSGHRCGEVETKQGG